MSKVLCCYESEIGDPAAWKEVGDVDEDCSERWAVSDFCAEELIRRNIAEWKFDSVVAVSLDGGQTWAKFDCYYTEECCPDYSDCWWALEAERVAENRP